jgi:hypothetical protein
MTGGGYAPVDGLDLSYEVHGTGRPLVRPFLDPPG